MKPVFLLGLIVLSGMWSLNASANDHLLTSDAITKSNIETLFRTLTRYAMGIELPSAIVHEQTVYSRNSEWPYFYIPMTSRTATPIPLGACYMRVDHLEKDIQDCSHLDAEKLGSYYPLALQGCLMQRGRVTRYLNIHCYQSLETGKSTVYNLETELRWTWSPWSIRPTIQIKSNKTGRESVSLPHSELYLAFDPKGLLSISDNISIYR